MMNRRRFFAVAVMGAGLSVLAASPVAVAQPPLPTGAQPSSVGAEVMVLHATQTPGPGSIDPSIGNLPQLKKPPFSAYNTYKLIDRKALVLEKNKPTNYTMVNSRILQVTLEEITADNRYKVATAINQPSGNGDAFLKLLEVTAAPNETFFVAGQAYQSGILVIGITIKP
jgi:hypothetical protein